MPINGQKIDSSISPDKMKKSDRSAMYTAAVDVASLPGGWHQTKGVSEELFTETQKMAQLTSTILQSAGKFKQLEVQDTTWNSTMRHSLGKIKSRDNVFAFMKKLRKSKKSAFQQQDNLIELFTLPTPLLEQVHPRVPPNQPTCQTWGSQFPELL
jgi:hypothetical protein